MDFPFSSKNTVYYLTVYTLRMQITLCLNIKIESFQKWHFRQIIVYYIIGYMIELSFKLMHIGIISLWKPLMAKFNLFINRIILLCFKIKICLCIPQKFWIVQNLWSYFNVLKFSLRAIRCFIVEVSNLWTVL